MATPQLSLDRGTFLANLRQSGLLSDKQFSDAESTLPEATRGRHVARKLVEQGILTRFQAERLLAGRTGGFVLGQYRILDQLGSGGMGRVYKAEHRTMRRLVALKLLAPDLLKTERAQELFKREVRAVAQLHHPNIVTAYDANHVGDRYYLILEYVEGPNLDQLVREQGPLPVGQACDFIRQVALGLQHAHELGMVHRDIKPANLLIQRGDGRSSRSVAKISDFGLARLHESDLMTSDGMGTIVTKDNVIMGTPDYLSPEQARSLHKVDIRSDLYSLGCTFYFLLAGRTPFPGGNTLEKLVRHGTEQARPLSEFRSDIPAPIVALIEKLMAKEAADRFQTPADLAAALEPFAVGGLTAWAARKSAEEIGEEETPDDSDLVLEGVGSGEAAALVSTLSSDLSPTSLVTADFSGTRLPRVHHPDRHRRLGLAVALAIAIVGGLLGLAAVINLMLPG
ncbi:MAG: serine/threonine-protein kinase [Gemmataceae bacterium]